MIVDLNLNTSVGLELFNGSDVILKGIFILWGLNYLWQETRRRSLHLTDWFMMRLPPSMGFVIAVLVSDGADWLRSFTVWIWRRFDLATDFTPWQVGLLITAGIVGMLGGLCKIRAVTKPDQGNEPWLVSLLLVMIFIAASTVGRYTL